MVIPDVGGRDALSLDAVVDVPRDAPDRACTWRISREAPIEVAAGFLLWPPTTVFAAASGAEVWLGLNVGTSRRTWEIQRVGVDGAPLAPPVVVATSPPSGRWLSRVYIALDPPRRALIHAEQGFGCQFVRFQADGTLAAPVAVGLDHCSQLRATPTGFTLWGAPDTATADRRVTLDNVGVITRSVPSGLPIGTRRLADVDLADGAILILWSETGATPSNMLHIQRFGADGSPSGPVATFAGAAGTQVWSAEIAPTPDGFAVAWIEVTDPFGSGPVRLARLDARGTPQGSPQTIGTQTRHVAAGVPTLAVSHGYALLSWHEIDGAGAAHIVVQPVALDGAARPAPLALGARLDPGTGFMPIQIVATPTGALLTAWVAMTPMTTTTEIVALTCD